MTTPFLTERRQIMHLKQYMRGDEPQIDPEQLDDEYAYIYDVLLAHPPEQAYTALVQLKLREPDYAEFIEAIFNADPDEIIEYPPLSELGKDLQDVEWLWEEWINRGDLTLLAARPGVGKTYFALDLARLIIGQHSAPNGSTLNLDERRNVIYVDAEAFLPAVYQRTRAWEMNLEYFFPMQRPARNLLDLAAGPHQDMLLDMAYELNPALIIIDSLSTINSRGENNIQDIRDVLGFLVDLAQHQHCAVILIHHLRKGNGLLSRPITMDDLRGSSHLVSAARSVLAMDSPTDGPDYDPNGPRMLKVLKANFQRIPKPLAVHFEPLPDGKTVQLRYEQMDTWQPEVTPTLTSQCAKWLLGFLADGPQTFGLIQAEAENVGFKVNVLQNARRQLNGQVIDTVGPRRKGNRWQLAESVARQESAQ